MKSFLLGACLAAAFSVPHAAAQGIPAPEAWEYVRMTPEARSALRDRVDALPPELREAHNTALSANVNTLPTWLYEALSNELVARHHCTTGSYNGPKPKPPVPDAWGYVKRVPHQRYHYRLRARLLPPDEKAAYDAKMAGEMAKLPAWLKEALEEEAVRYDAYLGLDPCKRPGIGAFYSDAPKAVATPQSVQWDLTSAKGQTYRIMIAPPLSPPPPEGWPVVYVLDGNANFGTVSDALRLQGRRPERTGVSAALVVGIGYPIDGPFDEKRRGYDYVVHSPGATSPKHGADGQLEADSGGGAADFLSFIETELKPAVEKAYAVDRKRQTLLGHSFGGFFTLYTLFNRPQAFQNYLAFSPSVWWNNRSLLEDERRFTAARKASDPPVSLFVATGGLEETQRIPMVTDSREVVSRLKAAADRGVKTDLYIAEGEDHGSIVPTALSRALRARIGDGFEKTAGK